MAHRVLLVEDHTIVRDGVKALLGTCHDISVVGEAADGREAVRLVDTLNPDVVVMDIAMPRLNGIEAARQIRTRRPEIRILMLSMHGDRRYIFESLRAGASGYLLKDAAYAELVSAIRSVAGGSTYLSRSIAGTVMDDYVRRAGGTATAGDVERLTGREKEILQLIAEGHSGTQVARKLHISPSTVETHRHHIMEKLDVHNVVDLVKAAIRAGLVELD